MADIPQYDPVWGHQLPLGRRMFFRSATEGVGSDTKEEAAKAKREGRTAETARLKVVREAAVHVLRIDSEKVMGHIETGKVDIVNKTVRCEDLANGRFEWILSHAKSIRNLSLAYSNITEEQLKEIVKALPHLESLSLVGCESIKDFSALRDLKALRTFKGPTHFSDRDLEPITHCTSLVRLDLSESAVTLKGLEGALPKLTNLKDLYLDGMFRQDTDHLQVVFPNLSISAISPALANGIATSI